MDKLWQAYGKRKRRERLKENTDDKLGVPEDTVMVIHA